MVASRQSGDLTALWRRSSGRRFRPLAPSPMAFAFGGRDPRVFRRTDHQRLCRGRDQQGEGDQVPRLRPADIRGLPGAGAHSMRLTEITRRLPAGSTRTEFSTGQGGGGFQAASTQRCVGQRPMLAASSGLLAVPTWLDQAVSLIISRAVPISPPGTPEDPGFSQGSPFSTMRISPERQRERVLRDTPRKRHHALPVTEHPRRGREDEITA